MGDPVMTDARTVEEAARMVMDAANALLVAAVADDMLPDGAPRLTLPYVTQLTETIELGTRAIRRAMDARVIRRAIEDL